eukprot:m.490351 g.490351  ORF g.490351 m.490351 type:complete len:177 (-) comp57252_c0_seq5:1419-1949(-)
MPTANQLLGYFLLLASQITTALMLGRMDMLNAKYNPDPNEYLLFEHLLALPAFLLMAPSLHHTFDIMNRTWDKLWGTPYPVLWVVLAANLATQYFCAREALRLQAISNNLTATLVTTLRRFVSLALSVLLFGHAWGLQQWIASALVFTGALVYFQALPVPRVLQRLFAHTKPLKSE